jgi:hypothetical protein
MSHTVLLNVHIAAGAIGLLLGPLAMWRDTHELGAGRRPAGGISAAYPWTVLAVSPSAIVLVAWYRNDLWWLAPVAAASTPWRCSDATPRPASSAAGLTPTCTVREAPTSPW